MKNLLMKELRLAFHPTVLIFWLLSAMLMIPSYPYTVVAFYTMLGIFFVCLNGRENHDMEYTLNLPIRKRDLVKARYLFVAFIELMQLVFMGVFIWLHQMIEPGANSAGLDANIAFLGYAMIIYAIGNYFFLTNYYKQPDKVGKVFGFFSVFVFFVIAILEASSFIVPFIRDVMETPDPQFLTQKLLLVGGSAVIYMLLTFLSFRRSAAVFEKLDL